eukprot:7250136-Alexandrium_andersonii.AAC.1
MLCFSASNFAFGVLAFCASAVQRLSVSAFHLFRLSVLECASIGHRRSNCVVRFSVSRYRRVVRFTLSRMLLRFAICVSAVRVPV